MCFLHSLVFLALQFLIGGGWCKRCDVTVILLAQMIKRRGQSCKSANRSQSYCPSEFSGPQTIHYIHGQPIVHVYVGNSSENIQIQEIFRHVKKVNVVNTCQFSLTVPNCNTPGYVFTKTSATFLSFTPQHCNYCTHNIHMVIHDFLEFCILQHFLKGLFFIFS